MSEAQKYTPPAELVESATRQVQAAGPDVLNAADRLFTAYGRVTDGKSAVTGAVLPPFVDCKPLVQAGWLEVMKEARAIIAEEQAGKAKPSAASEDDLRASLGAYNATGASRVPVVPPGQRPSVGRSVHFQHGDVACAALITGINDDGSVSLMVFPPDEQGFTTRAQQAPTEAPEPAKWNWSPRV